MSHMDDEAPQPFDASDPQQVADQKTKAGRRAKALKDVVKALLATQAGRMWMWDVLEGCNVFKTSFAQDALVMAFSEGGRNVGLRLLAQIPPESLVLMLNEAKEK